MSNPKELHTADPGQSASSESDALTIQRLLDFSDVKHVRSEQMCVEWDTFKVASDDPKRHTKASEAMISAYHVCPVDKTSEEKTLYFGHAKNDEHTGMFTAWYQIIVTPV